MHASTARGRSSALLVVDIQTDFLPGGALAVADGDGVIEPVRGLMTSNLFGLIVASQDWHPNRHISFASSHTGHAPFDRIRLYGEEQVLWPDHCVQGTDGAELDGRLPWDAVSAFIRKGEDPKVDSYSAFRNNWNARHERPPTGLGGFLRDVGVSDVYVCGLARDYCVRWTAEDAADLGFGASVVWDCTRAVDPGTDDAVRDAMIAKGIRIVESPAPR